MQVVGTRVQAVAATMITKESIAATVETRVAIRVALGMQEGVASVLVPSEDKLRTTATLAVSVARGTPGPAAPPTMTVPTTVASTTVPIDGSSVAATIATTIAMVRVGDVADVGLYEGVAMPASGATPRFYATLHQIF